MGYRLQVTAIVNELLFLVYSFSSLVVVFRLKNSYSFSYNCYYFVIVLVIVN